MRRMLTDDVTNVLLQVVLDLVVDQRVEAAADGARTCRASDHVLENEVPTDQERHELPHRHVAVHVRRPARLRHTHPELAVTQPCNAMTRKP